MDSQREPVFLYVDEDSNQRETFLNQTKQRYWQSYVANVDDGFTGFPTPPNRILVHWGNYVDKALLEALKVSFPRARLYLVSGRQEFPPEIEVLVDGKLSSQFSWDHLVHMTSPSLEESESDFEDITQLADSLEPAVAIYEIEESSGILKQRWSNRAWNVWRLSESDKHTRRDVVEKTSETGKSYQRFSWHNPANSGLKEGGGAAGWVRWRCFQVTENGSRKRKLCWVVRSCLPAGKLPPDFRSVALGGSIGNRLESLRDLLARDFGFCRMRFYQASSLHTNVTTTHSASVVLVPRFASGGGYATGWCEKRWRESPFVYSPADKEATPFGSRAPVYGQVSDSKVEYKSSHGCKGIAWGNAKYRLEIPILGSEQEPVGLLALDRRSDQPEDGLPDLLINVMKRRQGRLRPQRELYELGPIIQQLQAILGASIKTRAELQEVIWQRLLSNKIPKLINRDSSKDLSETLNDVFKMLRENWASSQAFDWESHNIELGVIQAKDNEPLVGHELSSWYVALVESPGRLEILGGDGTWMQDGVRGRVIWQVDGHFHKALENGQNWAAWSENDFQSCWPDSEVSQRFASSSIERNSAIRAIGSWLSMSICDASGEVLGLMVVHAKHKNYWTHERVALMTATSRRVAPLVLWAEDHRKREELQNITAHELRTPINIIKNAMTRGALDRAAAGILLLETYIDNQVPKMASEARLSYFNEAWYATSALKHLYKNKWPDEEEAMKCNRPLAVPANRLQQILINLAENAMKYSPESCRFRVALTSSSEGLVFEISNRVEKPIPKPARGRVFERGYRAAQDAAGDGLGLSIVKDFCKEYSIILNGPILMQEENSNYWECFKLIFPWAKKAIDNQD